jgi:hypothetical protein
MSYGEEFEQAREKAMQREGETCLFCEMSNEQHQEEYGAELHAHHVVPRINDGRDDADNLIMLCQACHRRIEEAHARAVGEKIERLEFAVDDVKATIGAIYAGARDIRRGLRLFLEDHPTFAEHHDIADDLGESSDLSAELSTRGQCKLGGEWEWAMALGYMNGVEDTVVRLEDETPLTEVLNEDNA